MNRLFFVSLPISLFALKSITKNPDVSGGLSLLGLLALLSFACSACSLCWFERSLFHSFSSKMMTKCWEMSLFWSIVGCHFPLCFFIADHFSLQKLMDPSLLTAKEIEWIDSYHTLVRDQVGSYLQANGKTEAYNWLVKETKLMSWRRGCLWLMYPNRADLIKTNWLFMNSRMVLFMN